MSTQQPEALRLAKKLDYHAPHRSEREAANELRRLHAANIDCMAWFESTKAERNTLLAAMPDLRCVITWLENGCNVPDAIKELKIYEAKINAVVAKAKGSAA